MCRDLVLVCPVCAVSVAEYHCAAHQAWKVCYFSFLDQFDEQQLQQQAIDLQKKWGAIFTPTTLDLHPKR